MDSSWYTTGFLPSFESCLLVAAMTEGFWAGLLTEAFKPSDLLTYSDSALTG